MIMFKIPPELVDGQHWSVCKTVDDLIGAVKSWAEETVQDCPGETFAVKAIEMTLEEYDKLEVI